MKRWLLFLFAEALIYYVALIYQSQSMLFFVLALMILVFLLFLYDFLVFRRVSIHLRASMNLVERGTAIPLEIRLKNRSFLPAGQVRFFIKIKYRNSGKQQKKVVHLAVPGREMGRYTPDGQRSVRILFQPKYTGFVTLSVKKAAVFDLFGILPLPVSKKRIYGEDKILVLPEQEEIFLDLPGSANAFRQKQESVFLFPGEKEPPEVAQIREYQPGDALRNIHWKLTAKRDDLMVCERFTEQNCSVIFFVDFQKLTDSFLGRFYSIAMELVNQDVKFYLVYYDPGTGEIMRHPVFGEQDFYEYLLQMDRPWRSQDHSEWEKDYQEKYRQIPAFPKIILWHDLRCEGI